MALGATNETIGFALGAVEVRRAFQRAAGGGRTGFPAPRVLPAG